MKPQQPSPFHQTVLASKPGGPMHSDCLQTGGPIPFSRPHQAAGYGAASSVPTKGTLQPVLGSAAFHYVTFHIPVSAPGAFSPVQAPGLDNSTPCLDFCPGFCFPPPQLPSGPHFSSNQSTGSTVPPKPRYRGVAAPCGVSLLGRAQDN